MAVIRPAGTMGRCTEHETAMTVRRHVSEARHSGSVGCLDGYLIYGHCSVCLGSDIV